MAQSSLKGRLLVASPQVDSPLFSKSVVLVLEHSEEAGAKGIILNLPTSATMTDLAGKLFDDDFAWDKPLLLGGPVSGPLMVLHTRRDMADLEVGAGLYLALDATKSQDLISHEVEPSLVIANFSGWAPGQLEAELSNDVWITADVDSGRVFGEDQDLWNVMLRGARNAQVRDIVGLREIPADPNLN